MTSPRTLPQLIAVSEELSLEDFLRTFGCPYLVASGVLSGKLKESRERNETGVLELGRGQVSHTPSDPNPLAGTIYPLEKRSSSRGEGGRITVGRAGDQDISIPDASVSHAHAYFEREGEAVFLADTGSRNGTFVNLARLQPGDRSLVHDEDVLTFGRISYQLFSPAALFVALRAFREGSL